MYEIDNGMLYDENFDTMAVTEVKTELSMDSVLSNWFLIGGVSAGTLVLSVVIGLLLAKAKIKKGFDVYED